MSDLAAPVLRRFCTLEVEVGPMRTIGPGPFGQRRSVPIVGGRVSGPDLRGRILPGGADWQTVGADGVSRFRAQYLVETDAGALVEVIDAGFRHGPPEVMKRLAAGEPVSPADYYMRSTTRLHTGEPDLAWINATIFVSTGARRAGLVQIDVFAVG